MTIQTKTTKQISVTHHFNKGWTVHNIGPANPSWILYSEWGEDPRNKDGSIVLHNGVIITGGEKGEGTKGHDEWRKVPGLWLVRAKHKHGWQYPKYCCPSDKWQLYGFCPHSLAEKTGVITFNDFSSYWEFDDFQPLR